MVEVHFSGPSQSQVGLVLVLIYWKLPIYKLPIFKYFAFLYCSRALNRCHFFSQQRDNKHMPSFPSKGILVYLYMCGIRWSGFVIAKAHFSFALNSYLTLKPEFTHHSSHHGRDFTQDLSPLGFIKIGLQNIWLHSRNISL